MSLDAIKRAAEAEAQSKRILEEASARARKLVSDAEVNARVLIEEAIKDAEQQAREMLDKASAEADTAGETLKKKNQDDCTALKTRAAANIPKAASFIAERIVTV